MEKVIIILKRTQKSVSVLIAVLLAVLTVSCNKEKSSLSGTGKTEKYKSVNKWILKNMQNYYLWNTEIPSKTDQSLYPADYFESLLSDKDRFSWIQENYVELLNSLSGVNTEAGYDFNLLRMSENSSDVIGYITYIKPGTPAEAAGLSRGNYFHEINGTQMTTVNYSALIKETSKSHTLGVSVMSGNTITGVRNVSLGVIENYPENPILLDTVYNISDKNIGYFVYNFFARDNGDGSVAYEKELNSLFGKFKSEQIDELIVDLRYNGGGTVITATALASMISGQSTNSIFYTEEYNFALGEALKEYYGANYNKSYFINTIDRYNSSGSQVIERIPINSLSGLSTVYFIVSGSSASASELLINGLKPYMNVVLVGGTTYGKNVASISLYEENDPDNTWGMQPIVMKMSNVTGFSDFGDGFTPDKTGYEYQAEARPIRQLGDTEEFLLRMTIDMIFPPQEEITATTKHSGYSAIPSFIGSAIDRTPARRNQYITLKEL
jgi:C-terminal processing protease CtpA/Prc